MTPNLIPIDPEDWQWHGIPLHFIGSRRCCFHLGTTIGTVRVSTVGCYHPTAPSSEYSMDNRETLSPSPDSWYETMIDEGEGWGNAHHWPTPEEAEAGHLSICKNVARGRHPLRSISPEVPL